MNERSRIGEVIVVVERGTGLGLDRLLRQIGETVQLSVESHRRVRREYAELGGNLLTGPLVTADPVVYPQGSYALGTTVRPLGRDEFDLDCILELHDFYDAPPDKFVRAVSAAVADAAPAEARVEQRDRCTRLSYPGHFHVDVVGARPAPAGGTAVSIPARTRTGWSWQDSDPKAYQSWFKDRSRVLMSVKASLEPLPTERVETKAALEVAVQLVKRHHHLHVPDESLRTSSIVLTSIVGQSYFGGTLSEALSGGADALSGLAIIREPTVVNPVNPSETLSRNWSDPAVLSAFRTAACRLAEQWSELNRLASGGAGAPAIKRHLDSMFGENLVTAAYKALGRAAHDLAAERALRTGIGGALSAVQPSQGNPRHTHYGT